MNRRPRTIPSLMLVAAAAFLGISVAPHAALPFWLIGASCTAAALVVAVRARASDRR